MKSLVKKIGRLPLRLEHLEQRALLDAASLASPPAGPATHFALWAPHNETAGNPAPLELAALDASNHLVQNFTGTVSFTSSDAKATLPADYVFTASDHGHHLFHITPATPGSETVTATDAADKISGDITVNVNPAPVATHFFVYAPENTTVGTPTGIVVVALDASNHRVSNYTGTVDLTTNDPGVTTPLSYTFTAADHGRHVFKETFATVGTWTATATDHANSSLTGTASINVNPAPVATHFAVFADGSVFSGRPFTLEVVALDASNHRVPNYAGTVHLTSSVSGETLPADYTFTAADEGEHEFQVTLNTLGADTLTASDGKLTGSVAVNVQTAPTGSGGGGGQSGGGQSGGDQDNDGANPSNPANIDAFFAAFAGMRRWRG